MQNNIVGVFRGGFPCVDIEVIGSAGVVNKITVVIDTGFNGGLSLSYADAFPIGLTLTGIALARLADGNTSTHLSCLGEVALGENRARTAIDVQQNGRPLLGTGLLKDLGYSLEVNPIKETVTLTRVR